MCICVYVYIYTLIFLISYNMALVSAQTRQCLFYFVCVPIRLTLAALPVILSEYTSFDKKVIVLVYFSFAIITFFNLTYKLYYKQSPGLFGDTVWWNRKVHAFFALCLIFACIINLVDGQRPYMFLLTIVMGFDVVFGVYSCMTIQPFRDFAHQTQTKAIKKAESVTRLKF